MSDIVKPSSPIVPTCEPVRILSGSLTSGVSIPFSRSLNCFSLLSLSFFLCLSVEIEAKVNTYRTATRKIFVSSFLSHSYSTVSSRPFFIGHYRSPDVQADQRFRRFIRLISFSRAQRLLESSLPRTASRHRLLLFSLICSLRSFFSFYADVSEIFYSGPFARGMDETRYQFLCFFFDGRNKDYTGGVEAHIQ